MPFGRVEYFSGGNRKENDLHTPHEVLFIYEIYNKKI